MTKQDEIVPDAELEAFIAQLKKRTFTHRDVTRCYSTFVKNEYHRNDDNIQQPTEIYGRQRSGGKRIPVRWSEQETEALKEGVSKLGKGNWSRIIGLYPDIFGPTARTGRDLKKKWNSIEMKNNNRKNHPATRLKATLVLPNHEIPGIPSSIPIMAPILPRSEINPNEPNIDDKEIKTDIRLAKIVNPQNMLNIPSSLADKGTNNQVPANMLMIPDLPKDSDVSELLGIAKESEVFRVSEDNHQLLITLNLTDNNSPKQNDKESGDGKDLLNK